MATRVTSNITATLLVRASLAAFVATTVTLGTITYGCNDVGGVPSWERCTSALGHPIIEWSGDVANNLIPLALGLGGGALTWLLLGRREPTAKVVSAAIVAGCVLAWIL